jgi:hypothetical protein
MRKRTDEQTVSSIFGMSREKLSTRAIAPSRAPRNARNNVSKDFLWRERSILRRTGRTWTLYNKPGRSFSLKEKLPPKTFKRTVRIVEMCTRMISETLRNAF